MQAATIRDLVIPGTDNRKILPEDIDAVTMTWLLNDRIANANSVRMYAWKNSVWYEVDCKNELNSATVGAGAPIQVPVLAAGQEWKERFDVAGYEGVCFEYTSGVAAPTVWSGSVSLHLNIGAFEL